MLIETLVAFISSPQPLSQIICAFASSSPDFAKELVKWLGQDAINPFAVDGKVAGEELTKQLRQWASATGRAVIRPVLIISYETLRLYVNELRNTPIGLLSASSFPGPKVGDEL